MSTAKRLAKNTMFMYARMGILMLISLYTSRVVLQQLGVDDYGTYGLVGSVVGMFTALRTLFAGSIQRFVNFEMGRGNLSRLKLVFNMGTLINLITAVIFVIAAEAVGYWFLNFKMEIDPTRLYAAKVVFQFSILSAVAGMLTTPFDALVIAHERMDFYAICSIFEGVLRLGIVFLLSTVSFDKLIFYGFLQLAVTVVIRFCCSIFCRRNFQECRYARCWDKGLFKEMFSFAGWNFLGNTIFALVQNGLNMMLNVFCGLAANAARSVAYSLNNALGQAMNSVTVVINPFSTKTFASGDLEKTFKIAFFSTKIYYTIQSLVVIPFAILAYQALHLWLGKVPEYSVGFLQLVLLYSLTRSPHNALDNLFRSAGVMRHYQIAEIIVQSFPLIVSYIFMKEGCSPYWMFVSVIVFDFVNYAVIINIAKRRIGLPAADYFKSALLPCLISLAISAGGFALSLNYPSRILPLVLIATLTMAAVFSFMFFVGFSDEERSQIISVISKSKNTVG